MGREGVPRKREKVTKRRDRSPSLKRPVKEKESGSTSLAALTGSEMRRDLCGVYLR